MVKLLDSTPNATLDSKTPFKCMGASHLSLCASRGLQAISFSSVNLTSNPLYHYIHTRTRTLNHMPDCCMATKYRYEDAFPRGIHSFQELTCNKSGQVRSSQHLTLRLLTFESINSLHIRDFFVVHPKPAVVSNVRGYQSKSDVDPTVLYFGICSSFLDLIFVEIH